MYYQVLPTHPLNAFWTPLQTCMPWKGSPVWCVVDLSKRSTSSRKIKYVEENKGNFIPGDLSVIVDDSATRNSWILGHALRIVSGEKGMKGVLI